MSTDDAILPFADGTSAKRTKIGSSRPEGQWRDLGSGDQLLIAGHGHKYSTEKVTWVLANKKISWTASQLASAIKLNLANCGQRRIDFHILACFGANNMTPLAKSFGSKLARELKVRGIRGTLTAYKGVTGMMASRGHQTGTSRISAAPKLIFGGSVRTTGNPTKDAGVIWQLHR